MPDPYEAIALLVEGKYPCTQSWQHLACKCVRGCTYALCTLHARVDGWPVARLPGRFREVSRKERSLQGSSAKVLGGGRSFKEGSAKLLGKGQSVSRSFPTFLGGGRGSHRGKLAAKRRALRRLGVRVDKYAQVQAYTQAQAHTHVTAEMHAQAPTKSGTHCVMAVQRARVCSD
eukprot:6177368-Pleurochrysis_carterae.AAC.1